MQDMDITTSQNKITTMVQQSAAYSLKTDDVHEWSVCAQ